jgi:hypothetical protein
VMVVVMVIVMIVQAFAGIHMCMGILSVPT